MKGRIDRSRRRIGVLALLSLAAAILPAGSAVAAVGNASGYSSVATGLDNPRGLAFKADGTLVVGEAGHASSDVCLDGGPEGTVCIGFNSQISAVDVATGSHTPLLTGFVSLGDGPLATTGIDGVTTVGNQALGIVTISQQALPPLAACDGDATCQQALTRAAHQVGRLVRVAGNGVAKDVANVGAFNYDYVVANAATLDPDNPDFAPGDANPYDVVAVPGGSYVIDAGSNTLDFVTSSGKISVLAYIPNPEGPPDQRFPYDAVPTCVTNTRQGVYVADLAGRLWKWSNGSLTEVALPDGMLFAANGCTSDKMGNVYVVDMFSTFGEFGFAPNTGSVIKVTPSGHASVIATGLNLPGGIAVARGGGIYVANNSVCPNDVSGLEFPFNLFCPVTGEVVLLNAAAG